MELRPGKTNRKSEVVSCRLTPALDEKNISSDDVEGLALNIIHQYEAEGYDRRTIIAYALLALGQKDLPPPSAMGAIARQLRDAVREMRSLMNEFRILMGEIRSQSVIVAPPKEDDEEIPGIRPALRQNILRLTGRSRTLED